MSLTTIAPASITSALSAPATAATSPPIITPTFTAIATATIGSGVKTRGTPTCRRTDLAASVDGREVAVGNTAVAILLRNTSHRACSLTGTPDVALLDRHGHRIAVDLERNRGSYLFARVRPRTVVIAPGATAFFRIGASHVAGVPHPCATSARIAIRLTPREPDPILIAAAITSCNRRRIDLSPIQPGLPGNGVTSSATRAPLASRARRTE